MINKIELISMLVLFCIIYLIIFADHKLHKKCKCDDCYLSSNRVSIKIPLLITIFSFILYKLSKPLLKSYVDIIPEAKQNIITEMADF